MEKVEKLRILFLSSWFPDRNQPTLGNFVKRHAQAVALKHDVVVVHAVADSSISEEEWVHQKNGNYEELKKKLLTQMLGFFMFRNSEL